MTAPRCRYCGSTSSRQFDGGGFPECLERRLCERRRIRAAIRELRQTWQTRAVNRHDKAFKGALRAVQALDDALSRIGAKR